LHAIHRNGSIITMHLKRGKRKQEVPPQFIAMVRKECILNKKSLNIGQKHARLVGDRIIIIMPRRFVRRVERLSKWILPVTTLIALSASTATI
jgi:hypothetical protein